MSKFLLILLLCGAAIVSKADGDIINEDFSKGFETISDNYLVRYANGWTVSGCKIADNEKFPKSLVLDYSWQNYISYAVSPAFGENVTSRVVLSFSYAKFSPNGTPRFFVKLNEGGIFEDGADTKYFDVMTEQGTFEKMTLDIFGATPLTTITFQLVSPDSYFVIDDVKVTSVKMSLSESENNVLEDVTTDVHLTRTLTGGIWNTLCLPFDVDHEILKRALGDSQDIQLRVYSDYAAGVMKFSSVDSVDAGTPFLIKLNETVENPIFKWVNVTTIPAKTITHNNGVSFVGTYSPKELPSDGANVYMFLSANGTLMKPNASGRTLKGMRAYFAVPSAVNARLIFDGDDVASITDMFCPAAVEGEVWHTLNGARYVQQPTRGGLYIKNGKKIITK